MNTAETAVPVTTNGPGAVPFGCPVVLVKVPVEEAVIEMVA